MKFTEVLDTVNLIIECGDVPLIIGESGIGKTALAHEVAKKNDYKLVTIDANLLKEGEIGGLPTVIKGETIYATHHKLVEIKNAVLNNNDVLLFIDELNRCEHAVQQELMNLILNKEINGYELSDSVKILAAMNPSNKYDNFENSDYQVIDMDPAQEDRFVWVEMDSDIKEWIRWGMSKDGDIHEDIIEFISTFPQYLHTPNSRESIKATPRSWKRVSKAYTLYKKNSNYELETLLNVVRGNVGPSITVDFANHISNLKKPLLKSEDLFSYEVLPVELKDDLSNESHSRLYILAKNCLNYLNENSKPRELTIFSELLKVYPRDLRLGIMKEIKKDYPEEVYTKLLDNEEFIEAFFDIYTDI